MNKVWQQELLYCNKMNGIKSGILALFSDTVINCYVKTEVLSEFHHFCFSNSSKLFFNYKLTKIILKQQATSDF